MTTVSVVVVGYGEEPDLSTCLRAIVDDLGPGDDVVLVDNGVTALPDLTGVQLVTAPRNGGFGAGCHLGVDATSGDVLVFVNSDAVIEPGTIDALRSAASDPCVGLVTGLVLMADDHSVVNAAGNPVHFLGISWAGGYGDEVAKHQERRDVASVSGALFAARRDLWTLTGGLDPLLFLYHEDTDLSLRCHVRGLRVVFEPRARASHAYDFRRNTGKLGLLERNRLLIVFTLYEPLTLVLITPALLLFEVLVSLVALRQGWFRDKCRGWVWLAWQAPALARRRRTLRRSRTVSDARLLALLTGDLYPGSGTGYTVPVVARLLSRAYWSVAKATWRRLSGAR